MNKRMLMVAVLLCAWATLMAGAQEARGGVLFQIGGGLAQPSYPGELEAYMSYADSQPGVERMKLGLNIGLGVPISAHAYLMGRIDGLGDRVYDSYDYMQLNLYLYSVGARYYPAMTGFFVEGSLGASKAVVMSSAYGMNSSNGALGYGVGIGYDFNPAMRGLSMAVEARYAMLDIEGSSVGAFLLMLSACVK